MLYMLDTETSSYVIRNDAHANARAKLQPLKPGEVCISAMTRAELLFGLRRVPENKRLQVGVRKFLHTLQVLAWEPDAAEFYAEIRYQLTRTGNIIGEMDMLIAAHAIAVDATLVTNNARHFERTKLPLMLANWME